MKLTPKGMRDIDPEVMIIREDVINSIKDIFCTYGYRPLETPAMEYLDTLRAKAGEEVDKQIFVIDGGEYGLRFDLTVPLARYASSTDAPKPFKRYQIERVWRKEEPQRGRFREFWQADVDVIGTSSMRAEAEILSLAREVCFKFGFNKPRIIINNRKILDAIADKIGVSEKRDEIFRALDKLDKIGEKEVAKLLKDLVGAKANELIKIVKSGKSNKERLSIAVKYSPEGAKELEEIVSLCNFDIEIDLFLVRGLGYYTGPVFEVKLSEDIGSVAGGGRYDRLLAVYGQDLPAVGISFGIERLITLMLEKEKAARKTRTTVFVAAVKPDFYPNANELASKLRKKGISCETDLNERNLKKQFDYTNALSIPYMIVLGEREIESSTYTIRDMSTGKEKKLSFNDLVKEIKGR
ncbi:histidine--tRNA ligase [Candidatus Micrarchaeota archaeon]|nr:histidine--tRNA ligase [Candidatus Micrarchaeota archaeon]